MHPSFDHDAAPVHPDAGASAIADAPAHNGWQPLPRRARALMALTAAVQFALLGAGLGVAVAGVLAKALDFPISPSTRWTAVALWLAITAAAGAWQGVRQHRHTLWRHDAQGLALRRGRLWHRETRVPATRVQHLDVTRGPLQRGRDLATLVVHTAGTQHGAVRFPNLDAGDAERLRDALGRQIDHDDDA